VERLLGEAFPGYQAHFVSLGSVSHFTTIAKYIGKPPLPYRGAHPNCESFYLLVSDGEKYLPVDHFLEKSLAEFTGELLELEKKFRDREERWKSNTGGQLLGALHLKGAVLRLLGLGRIVRVFWRNIRVGRIFKGKGLGKLYHALMSLIELPFSHSSRNVRARHLNVQGMLSIIILPLEDDPILETERLERCPSTHVVYNPKTGEFKYVPVCSWRLFNKQILRELAEAYGEKDRAAAAASPTA
jgi:hypothetical protein